VPFTPWFCNVCSALRRLVANRKNQPVFKLDLQIYTHLRAPHTWFRLKRIFIFSKTFIIFVAFGQLFWQKEKTNVQRNITTKFFVLTLHMMLYDKAKKFFF
jgi:hypothetical protein